MIRKLAFVATAGILGGALILAADAGLSEQGRIDMRHLWALSPAACASTLSGNSQITLPFPPINAVTIDLPGSVEYQPGERAEITLTGDPRLVDHFRFDEGRLRLDCDPGRFAPKLNVIVSGPAIADWTLLGSGNLTLAQINQAELHLRLRGSGDVAATGAVDMMAVDLLGSGAAKLGGVTSKSVEITVSGSGDVQMTAQKEADISILGSGNVELSGNPILRQTRIVGSGRIFRVK